MRLGLLMLGPLSFLTLFASCAASSKDGAAPTPGTTVKPPGAVAQTPAPTGGSCATPSDPDSPALAPAGTPASREDLKR